MKKMFITALTLAFMIISFSTPLSAGTFGTAGTLRPGHFALGLEPAIGFSPSTFMLYIHGGLGLAGTIDLDLKLGLGTQIYFGADLEFVLARDTNRGPGLSLTVGGHGAGNFGLDTTLLISNRFHTFSLFGALDMDIEFVDTIDGTEIQVPVYFDIGVAIPLARKVDFILEGNIGITSYANSGLSGGVVFYF